MRTHNLHQHLARNTHHESKCRLHGSAGLGLGKFLMSVAMDSEVPMCFLGITLILNFNRNNYTHLFFLWV